MTEIPVNVATNIIQKLVDGAINETRYLCCYGNIVEGHENERNNLIDKQRSVEEDVREARDKNEEPVKDVRRWQSIATDMSRERTIVKKSCFFGLLPNCIWLYRQGRALERETQKIRNHIERCKFDNFAHPIKPSGVEYYSSKDFIQFESRNSAQRQLHGALNNSGNYMIGLHGIGGSGKTKLAQKVGVEVKKSELFDQVIFVVVSNPPNVCKIRDDIARELGFSLNRNESEPSKSLCSRLTNGQKILIILDDIWEKLNFTEIGIPSHGSHKGCRILLTTRDLNVCKSMGCQQMIQLELLLENEAWILFQRFADISNTSSRILKHVAQKITSECSGLPVAIIAIASTLKEQPLEEWKAASRVLRSSKPMDDIQEDIKHVYISLRVSYNNLKSDKAKCLFLLCSMFPEDHEISNEELIRYAIGIGLFGELGLYQTSRRQVRTAKDKLINCCLLLNAKNKGCVKMHDLIRDVAHWIANNEIHEIMEPKKTLKALQEDSIVKQDKVRYLYCHNIRDFSCQLDLPNLEILVLACKSHYDDSVSIPDTFFDGMRGIRVLTLKGEYHWETSVQLRPTSIEVLKNLRSLDLRNCNLGDISAFGSLQKIETLELYHCSINEMPNGIVELKELRLLRLQSCEINESPYKVIGRFSEIEELYLMENRISNGSVDRAVVSDLFDEDRISPTLEMYHIEIGVDNDVLNGYLNESTSRALSIGHFDASISNVTMKDMMQRAEILCLHKLEGGCKSISPDFNKAIGGDMIELIKLGLYDCSEIECLIDTTTPSSSLETVFSYLTTLRLRKMDNLKELFPDPTPSDFLQKLEDLSISFCPKLTYLFPGSITQSLVLLKNLTIENCDAMEYIIKEESEETMNVDHGDGSTLGPNKRKISDSTVLSGDPATMNCSQLQNRGLFVGIQKLKVDSCRKLTYLFPVIVAQSLVQLEEIEIWKCDAMKCIIKDESGETADADQRSSLDLMFPKLQSINIDNCGQLECFLSVGSNKRQTLDSTPSSTDSSMCIRGCGPLECFLSDVSNKRQTLDSMPASIPSSTNSVSQDSNLFNNVRYMTLIGCPQLKWVFTLSNAATMQLEELYIHGCDGLKHIITFAANDHADYTSILPKFRTLSVIHCKQLEQIAAQATMNCSQLQNKGLFVGIQKLYVDSCPKLTYLFTVTVAQSLVLLEELQIYKCDAMECIIKDESGETVDANQRSSLISMFPKLQSISISNCGQLEYFLSVGSNKRQTLDSTLSSIDLVSRDSNLFNNVRRMRLEGCPQLKWVFTLSDAATMQLEILEIWECDGLKHIITFVGDDDANSSSILPKFRTLLVNGCKQLEQIATKATMNCSQLQNRGLFVGIHRLDVRSCPKLTYLFSISVAQSLVRLEEIYIEYCDAMKCIIKDESGETVDADQRSSLVSIFPKLQSISINNCGQLECFLSISSSKRQTLDSTPSSTNLVSQDSNLFNNVRDMRLDGCPQLKWVFTLSNAATMQLEDLYINGCDGLKHIITFAGDDHADYTSILPKFRSLFVKDCKQLEQIAAQATMNCSQLQNRGLFVGNFNLRTLQKLSVESCPKLTYLFTVTVAQSLVLLEGLEIRNCDAMKCIIKDESGETVDADQRSSLVSMFPKLQNVNILYCDRMECFLSVGSNKRQMLDSTSLSTDLVSQDSNLFNNVRDMRLDGCPQLKWVFTLSNAATMQLEDLYINGCDGLKHIITFAGDDHADYTSILPKFRSLFVKDCKQLEQIAAQATMNCSQLQNRGLFAGIHNLIVRSCPKLAYLFPVTVAESFVQLEEIEIRECDAMKCIIKDESREIVNADQRSSLVSLFPKLQTISIENCSQLECFLSVSSSKRQTLDSTPSSTNLVPQDSNLFNSIRHMRLWQCPELKWVFTLSNAATMQLEELYIWKCDGLKHIITFAEDDHADYTSTLPKLEFLSVIDCKQLEYVFGEYSQNHTSNVEIDIHAPALERLILESLPNMISICSTRYYLKCPSLKITSISDFIEHSNATQLKSNGDDSKELLKKYKQELQTEEEKFPENVSHEMTKSKETKQESVQEDSRLKKQVAEASSSHTKINDLAREQPTRQPELMGQQEEDRYTKTTKKVSQTTNIPHDDSIKETTKQSVQKIPTSEKEKMPTSSLVDSGQKNSQNTKGNIQEDLASTKVEIETPPCPSSELGDSMSDEFFPSMPKTSSQNIAGTVKQSVQEDVVPEKSKIETSLTNYGPRILSSGSSIIPIQNALPEELIENEQVDFHGLFKIDSRRASLLDNAFVKYPHLWDWQKGVRTKYCKFGYESLSDMLLFLKEKRPKVMDEPSKKEFEKLYAELLSFGFDRDWLASVHQRVTDLQVENEKLNHWIEVESRESILLNNTRAKIARIKDDVSKYETAFDF